MRQRKAENAIAFQRVPNSVAIEFRYEATGTPFVNIVYAEYPLGYDATDLDNLADAMETWAETGLITVLSSEVSYTGVTVTGLNAQNDLQATRQPAAPVAGGQAVGSCPLNVAFAVKFTAGLTGRSTRGRNYVGGIPENVAGRTTVTAIWADSVVNQYELMKAAIFGMGWTMVIVSRYTNGLKRIEAETFPVVTISYTDTQIDTRRKRLSNE